MSFVHPDISAEKYKEIFGVSHRPQGKIGNSVLGVLLNNPSTHPQCTVMCVIYIGIGTLMTFFS